MTQSSLSLLRARRSGGGVRALRPPAAGPDRTTSQLGQAMVEYVIVLKSLYSCGFREVSVQQSNDCPKLRRFFEAFLSVP